MGENNRLQAYHLIFSRELGELEQSEKSEPATRDLGQETRDSINPYLLYKIPGHKAHVPGFAWSSLNAREKPMLVNE